MLNKIVKEFIRRLSISLIDRQVIPGSTTYSRFIILSRSRTGSNLLRSLLDSHPQIYVYGEKYRDYKPNTRPVTRLKDEIFRKYLKKVKSVGFKLFYYHAHSGFGDELWKYLKENRDIKIIHLTRNNLLKTVVSRKVADVTNKWSESTSLIHKDEGIQITLNYLDCRNEFEKTENYIKKYKDFFKHHEVMEIVYEDFVKDLDSYASRLQKFLKVPYRKLKPSTRKQSKRPIEETVVNYSELKDKFAGTKWEKFFEK